MKRIKQKKEENSVLGSHPQILTATRLGQEKFVAHCWFHKA